MKFSRLVELITVNNPMDEFYFEKVIFLVIHDFTGFASTINTAFEIIFLNGHFS